MRTLEINITKAALQSFNVSLDENGQPNVQVTIGLISDGGKPITTYTAMTHAYSEARKMNLPIKAMPLLGELARILEAEAVKKCRDDQLTLPDLSTVPF